MTDNERHDAFLSALANGAGVGLKVRVRGATWKGHTDTVGVITEVQDWGPDDDRSPFADERFDLIVQFRDDDLTSRGTPKRYGYTADELEWVFEES